ncbi:hypothetical protein D9M68_979720 [compost metagenome]
MNLPLDGVGSRSSDLVEGDRKRLRFSLRGGLEALKGRLPTGEPGCTLSSSRARLDTKFGTGWCPSQDLR